jgi:hypothetical protein
LDTVAFHTEETVALRFCRLCSLVQQVSGPWATVGLLKGKGISSCATVDYELTVSAYFRFSGISVRVLLPSFF